MPYTDQQIRDYAYQLQSKGASADVIKDFVQKAKSEQGQTQTAVAEPQQQGTSFGNKIANFGLGALKGVVNTASNLTGMVSQGLDKIASPIVKMTTGHSDQFAGSGDPRNIIPKNAYTPTNTPQKLGFGAEQIAEFFIPVGGEAKLLKTADAAIETAKVAKLIKAGKTAEEALQLAKSSKAIGAAKLAVKSASSAVTNAAVTAAQTGSGEQTKNAGLIGAVLPVAGKAVSLFGTAAKKIAQTLSSGLSGVPVDAMEYALKNPKTVSEAITKAAQDVEMGPQKVYEQAKEALTNIKDARKIAYRKNLTEVENTIMQNRNGQWYVKRIPNAEDAKLPGYKGGEAWIPTNLSTKGLKDVTTRTLKEFGIAAKGQELDFVKTALPKSYTKEIKELVGRIYKWPDNSPLGMDDLREVVDSYYKSSLSPSKADREFNAIVQSMKENISSYTGERIPQISKMNAEYSKDSKVIREIIDNLNFESKTPQTSMRKLMNVFSPKGEVYRQVVKNLGDKGAKDLMATIAGTLFSKWTPEGLGKYLTSIIGGEAGLAAFANPAALATIPTTAAAASPRVIGRTLTNIGKVTEKLAKPGKIAKKIIESGIVRSGR